MIDCLHLFVSDLRQELALLQLGQVAVEVSILGLRHHYHVW